MSDLPELLLDGPAIANELGLHPVTIRNWASAGRITRRGRDRRGRTLYDFDEVHAFATRREPEEAHNGAQDGSDGA